MKGIVFTEFLEMVEETFGLEVTDQIIEESNLQSEGIYTSVGTYEFNEMVSLLTNLSKTVKMPANDLLHTFGLYLFDSLGKAHPEIIKNYKSPLALLISIEDHIHVHVKKLYPDAELPTFTVVEQSENSLSMIYSSSRGLYSLAHGLMEKTFTHFNESAQISYELLKEDGTQVKFDILQNG
ncbi:MAG: heme NO-binding domain-containing protein [Flavobacteriaceae bacterium]|nr:heme NO-binding domain-containing protein [Muriicola sp.]NNC61619.1 heme NO-binding domain-containing protein [Eudoraea sp.]NNK20818.1 heme NO-binding domain-containing protein [Flavobacteriaceae bacterium]MBT8289750.1 heme NO-binding domain-containing protein [Muriicola sp.]NNK34941.1 heme NO-binding domain-containing protein [Eudoraea sp.]